MVLFWTAAPALQAEDGGPGTGRAAIEVAPGAAALVLAVRTGPLPPGAELVLETPEGQRIGSVSPFGATAAMSSPVQIHLVPVPAGTLPEGRTEIRARLILHGSERAATAREFLGAAIIDN
ncbi:hypothetical protein [Rhodovulum visakhapatnamense]|uniref:Uncharacterized protein n=1 Tax=Rhodovulum visakhapatnamense TaxID=364297 RepID=A0A4R8G7L7_9RHOB|nr:hypothetical protein [Rhodovulum visakhapatnamense]TDX31378.1 hypothetical protein EV657_105227 [Rhodovulum visakhapatnamense]